MASLPIKALHLYTAPLSGCSARIRIAANLKSIPLIHHNINISKSEQTSPSYLTVNPNGSVPSLIVEYKDNGESHSIAITQSPAIFDFLETHFPTPPLLPKIGDFQRRARALEMASLVACDIQPPQNSRIRKQITTLFNGNGEEWARYVYDRGFGVYEKFLERAGLAGFGGRYSAGDEVSIADVFLVPAVQGGMRVGIDLEKWPLTNAIVDECWKLEAFRKGGLGGHGRLMP